MGFDPLKPYNDLPPLPPPGKLETETVLKAAIAARSALAELRGIGLTLPNQGMLVDTVVLKEARLSSEIEGVVTTNDRLYRALSETEDARDDPHAKEVLRYREALWYACGQLAERPLSTRLFEEVVQRIKQNKEGVRRTPGTQLRDARTGEVVYTPPEGEARIRDLLGNLEKFLHADSGLDPLVRMAVAHYQFEAIHPFSDGNGRTGRILNVLYLIHAGLLTSPVLFLSRFIIENKPGYYAGLRGVTEAGDWQQWLLYMLQAVETTAADTIAEIEAIRTLMERFRERVKEQLPKIYDHELIDLLFERPYCKISFLTERGIRKRDAASKHLRDLAGAGFLEANKIGREVVYLNRELMNVLSSSGASRH